MSDAIEPVEQREIDFHNDKVTAVVAPDGAVYVPIKPLCELIGITWNAQYERIQRDTILSEMVRGIRITRTPNQGGTQEMICLPLESLNGWLFTINDKRVKESVREPLLRYKRDCYRVLFEAFSSGIATRPDDDNELMQSSEPAAIAFRNALSVAKLAREQFYLSRKVDEHDRRLGLIEAQLSNPAAYVTQDQAQQIASAVKTVAMAMSEKFGGNHFGRIYNELYKRYSITEYKRLPSAKYEDAIGWLRSWWIELTSQNNAPF